MKRLALLSAGLLAGAVSSSVFAYQLNCKPVVWGDVHDENKIFTFVLENECILTADKPLDISGLKTNFENFITNSAAFNLRARIAVSSAKAMMSGIELSVHETRETANGELRIEGSITLLDDGKSHFTYDYNSTDVDGDHNAKYSKGERLEIDVLALPAPQTYQIRFKQTDVVRKPTLAPSSMFIRKAKEGITDEFLPDRDAHIKIMLGRKA
jgi:hypothetical protein